MEQDLIESLVVESISIYGHTIVYCPRTIVNRDDLFNEDTISQYNEAYEFDMYIRSYDNYEGDGTFLSKFNLEIRDQVRFVAARRTFYNEVAVNALIDRPQEGDLIFSPMMKRLFVIKYVNNTSPSFYQMGSLQSWELVCETFEYSNEVFNTGYDDIDSIEMKFSTNVNEFGLLTDDGEVIVDMSGFPLIPGQFNFDNQTGDALSQNSEFNFLDDEVMDWTHKDPFSEGVV